MSVAKEHITAGHTSDELDEPVPELINDEDRAELSLNFSKANDALLFVKAQQWWTVGSTLAVFVGLFVIAKLVGAKAGYISALTGPIILVILGAAIT